MSCPLALQKKPPRPRMRGMTRCRFQQTSAVLFFCLLTSFISITAVIAAGPPDQTFHLAISNDAVPAQQRLLRVNQGDLVRLNLTSDMPGEIHLHGYRLELKLTPGTAAELTFKARATGRYRIEWHRAGAPKKGGGHHGAALATLEVRPK